MRCGDATNDTLMYVGQWPGSEGKQLEACRGIVLAHVLTGNTSIQHLDVSANGLGPDGGKALAASIADNSTITSVSYQKYAFSSTFTDLSFPFPLSLLSLFTWGK